jgi:hypothetical protein
MSFFDFAPEIIYNIFSFLYYPEVYRLRCISRTFQAMAELHIYQEIKSSGQTVTITLGQRNKVSIELIAKRYDPTNRVIEFIPKTRGLLSLASTASSWSAYHRLFQIHFTKWCKTCPLPEMDRLSTTEKALLIFHELYNPAVEKTYELPHWDLCNTDQHYVGDRGFILNLSYIQQENTVQQLEHQILSGSSMTGLPTSYYGYHSVANSSPMPVPPSAQINWLRVTMDWVLNGMKTSIPSGQIYKSSYNKLDTALAGEGCFKYNPLSEPVLEYIIKDQMRGSSYPMEPLVRYVQSHSHECHTRLSRLQHLLEGSGVDAQVLWKYTFARSFVVGSGSLLGEEDVVRRIQDSEEEWRQKKLSLRRRLGKNNFPH